MLPVCVFIYIFSSGPAERLCCNRLIINNKCANKGACLTATSPLYNHLLFCWLQDYKTRSWKHQPSHRAACLNWTVCKVCFKGFYTHHRSQVIVLHQLEGVFVAWFKVISLGLAHISSGDWADSMDHIWKKKKVVYVYIMSKTSTSVCNS